jgi:hypothetical protein
MTRLTKTILAAVVILAVLVVAGNALFVRQDDRRSAAFQFAVNEPASAMKRIAQVAEDKGSLSGSGIGVAIPDKVVHDVGATRWTISPDGEIRGSAPDRGLAVVLTPEMRDKKVAWKCKVEPQREFLPGACNAIEAAGR